MAFLKITTMSFASKIAEHGMYEMLGLAFFIALYVVVHRGKLVEILGFAWLIALCIVVPRGDVAEIFFVLSIGFIITVVILGIREDIKSKEEWQKKVEKAWRNKQPKDSAIEAYNEALARLRKQGKYPFKELKRKDDVK